MTATSRFLPTNSPGRGLVLLACLAVLGCHSGSTRRGIQRIPRQRAVESSLADRDSMYAQEDGDDLYPDLLGESEPYLTAGGGADPQAFRSDDQLDSGNARGPSARGRVNSPEDVLRNLSQGQTLRLADARYHKQLGDDAFANLDYARAVKEYRQALDLNPALSDAREKWARASLVLGIRSGEIRAIQSELAEGVEVSKQERYADARKGIDEGRTLMNADPPDLDNAEKKFRRVYEELLWFEYPVDVTEFRATVKGLIQQVERMQRTRADEIRRNQEELVAEKAIDALDQEKEVRKQRVRELVRKAADYIRVEDFNKALDACNRILELDPNHRVAKYWVKDVTQQRNDQLRLNLFREEMEQRLLTDERIEESAIPHMDIFTFPPDEEWARVRRRKEQLDEFIVQDPEWVRKIKNTLDSERLTFLFEERPLQDVLTFLSDSTGITIFTDPAIDTQELLIDLSAKDMKAVNALNQIMLVTGLAYTFKENTLYITEKDKARGTAYFHIYNVSDILNKIRDFEGPFLRLTSGDDAYGSGNEGSLSFSGGDIEDDEPIDPTILTELIVEGSGGEENWGEVSTIEFHKGQLLVTATPEIHAAIQSTLQNLRQDADLFVVMEARFIDMVDGFLEDIGVDYRALGLNNNFGTPFGGFINDSSTGGNDLGFVKQGSPVRDVTLIMGQDRWGGRIQNIVDGFTGLVGGNIVSGGQGGTSGLTLQATFLEPFQVNVILRAVQEESEVRQLTAPIVTAHNGQRVFVSVITQRAYISDYELVSGGTGFVIIEVADPVVSTFQEGVILDVDPVISPDKKYITLDVRPTLASLIGGVISTIQISLGSFTNVANMVPIGVPEVSLQQTFTSVTVPNGGTVLLGGFKSLVDSKFKSYLPILGKIPFLEFLFSRNARITEKRSLVILITARIVDLRADEKSRYND